jgi:hypothetical protein
MNNPTIKRSIPVNNACWISNTTPVSIDPTPTKSKTSEAIFEALPTKAIESSHLLIKTRYLFVFFFRLSTVNSLQHLAHNKNGATRWQTERLVGVGA